MENNQKLIEVITGQDGIIPGLSAGDAAELGNFVLSYIGAFESADVISGLLAGSLDLSRNYFRGKDLGPFVNGLEYFIFQNFPVNMSTANKNAINSLGSKSMGSE